MDNFVFYTTIFDSEEMRTVAALLKREGIEFRIDNKSAQTMHRMPGTTYTEIDLLVREQDLEQAESVFRELDGE